VVSSRGFRKLGRSAEVEVDGLRALGAVVRVPRILEHGADFILLEQLDLKRSGDWSALARMLAALHRTTGPRFGWHTDNYIGATPQINSWRDDWSVFFKECRLAPQLALAKKNGYAVEIHGALKVLEGHQPKPSLLHGDLWAGNAGFIKEGPVLFDPAVYYGDREADLAMTELFGGFPREFYRAYDEAWPLDEGYERRKPMYNLYHLLNHLNLFGGSYLDQVESTLRSLR
jgi:protein-ribulosamine 3-kinase